VKTVLIVYTTTMTAATRRPQQYQDWDWDWARFNVPPNTL